MPTLIAKKMAITMDVSNTYTKLPDDFNIFISDYIKNSSSKHSFFEFYMLYAISRNLNLSIKLDNVFAKSIVALKNAFQIDDLCIMLLDDEAEELKVLTIDTTVNEPAKDIAVKIGE